MIIFDIIILIILIFFAIKGLKNGLIVEIGSLVALIAGFFLTSRFTYLIRNCLEGKEFPGSEFIPTISYVITFIAIVILIFFVAKLLTGVAKIIKINWLNKILGFVFGFIKGFIVIGGFFILIDIFRTKHELFTNIDFHKSYCFYPILDITKEVFAFYSF